MFTHSFGYTLILFKNIMTSTSCSRRSLMPMPVLMVSATSGEFLDKVFTLTMLFQILLSALYEIL